MYNGPVVISSTNEQNESSRACPHFCLVTVSGRDPVKTCLVDQSSNQSDLQRLQQYIIIFTVNCNSLCETWSTFRNTGNSGLTLTQTWD